jgi:DNA-binding NarL/FixJ family response regulator
MNDEISVIKVLLVDDQPLFVHSLAQVIGYRAPDIEVVGIVENGREAIEFARNKIPDVIIMDIKMPGMNGVEATKVILNENPSIKIMMLTTFDEDEYVLEALRYGAKGYLLKNLLPKEVIMAVRALQSGVNQISPSVIRKLACHIDDTEIKEKLSTKSNSKSKAFDSITEVEKEILELVVEGYSNKEIASHLNLAEQTVKNYLSVIFSKLNVHKRSQLVKKCMDDKYFQ